MRVVVEDPLRMDNWTVTPGSQFVSVGIRRELDRAVPVWVLTDGEQVVILRSTERPRGPRI